MEKRLKSPQSAWQFNARLRCLLLWPGRNRREFYYSGTRERLWISLVPCAMCHVTYPALPCREGSQQTIKLKCLPQAKVTRHKSKLAVRQPV